MGGVSIATGVIATDATGGGAGRGYQSPGVVAQSGATATLTGSTSETTLATVVIPANAMGLNGVLRISVLWSYTNNANNKTLSLTFGGSLIATAVRTTTAVDEWLISLRNRNNQTAQVKAGASVPTPASTTALQTFTVNTAASQNLVFTGTLANAADSIVLQGYTVEVLNP